MVENFGFDTMRIWQVIVTVMQYFVILCFNIIIIVICASGFKVKKSKGWFLLMLYGIINLLANIPNVFLVYGAHYFPVASFGIFMQGFSFVMTFFRMGAAILLIVGLFLLFKEYRSLSRA